MSTSKELRILKNIAVNVDVDEASYTFKTISTNALSTCHFQLLTGRLNGIKFGYLIHSIADYPPTQYTPVSTVIKIIDEIAEDLLVLFKNLFEMIPKEFELHLFMNMKLLIGGSVSLIPDLVTDGFLLLNDIHTNAQILQLIKEEHQNKPHYELSMHLVQHLKQNIIIIPPITFLLSREQESFGNFGKDVIEPPSVYCSYDCEANVANVGVEWEGAASKLNCLMAILYVDFDAVNKELVWELQLDEINAAKDQLKSSGEELKHLNDTLDFISQRLHINKSNISLKFEWPPRQRRKNASPACPIGMMLADWLVSAPEDISSWFIIPCPLGQRCLVVVQSHRTCIYGKYGNLLWTMYTHLPKQTILYCIYDKRSSIYHIIDIIMWNGQDYSTQIECQCRFFMLTSLKDDTRLNEYFQILPRMTIDDKQELIEAEDGYLLYHPLGFYEGDYSPLVCWLKPFMIEEILGIKVSYSINIPIGYTTAQAYMFEEQSNRKEQQQRSFYVH